LNLLPLPLREGVGGRGNATLFLDADDWLAPDALARLVEALDAAPNVVAVGGAYAFADTGVVRVPPSGDILHRLLVRNLFANGGHLLLRSAAVHAAGGFIPGIAYGEDWEFWIRIALQGPFAAVRGRAPVLFVRQHPSGAYHRLAADPPRSHLHGSHLRQSALLAASPHPPAAVRHRTEAENHWIIGRELIRHGNDRAGRARLRRSVRANPTAKRLALLATAHVLPLLPISLHGPFRSYLPARTSPAASPPDPAAGR
jgi:hypothetical protein